MEFTLTRKQYDLLSHTINGQGGFQSLQKKLLSQINEDLLLILNDDDVEKICRYIKRYGQGGAQKQFYEVFKEFLPCLSH